MPTIATELMETYASITRPVAYDMLKQLMERLNVPEEDRNIVIPGANGKLSMWNGDNIESREVFSTPSKPRVYATIKEDFIEDEFLTMVSRKDEYPPILFDPKTNIKISPIYSRVKANISIVYRSKDRYGAESFRDNWRRKIAELRGYMVFNARYTYPIPELMVSIMKRLYETRQVNLHEVKDFHDWLNHYCLPQLTYLTNASGEANVLALRERQENIYGTLTEVNPPELEKDDNGAAWTVSFDFEYQYDRVVSIYADYPIMINNELVHPALYPEKVFDYRQYTGYGTLTRTNYHKIQNIMGYYWLENDPYIRIPEFDYWRPAIKDPSYQPLLSALITVDPDDPTFVCNLKELGDFGLNENLIPLFVQQAPYLGHRNECPFQVRLHVGDVDNIALNNALIVDSELNVRSRQPLSLFKVQRMTVDLLTDFKRLNEAARQRFFHNPSLMKLCLDIIVGGPVRRYPKVINNKVVDVRDFENVCREHDITPHGIPYYFHPGRLMKTVGVFTVVTQREEGE